MRYTVIVLLFVSSFCFSQEKSLTVMFYNTENFFDTIDDPLKNDNEFLPESAMKWTRKRYNNKIKNISRVIDSASRGSTPALIGLCEVENETCVNDLIAKSSLGKTNYKGLITNSPDVRSIDVALIYNTTIFELKSFREINASAPQYPDHKTRNILFASFYLKGSPTELIHVFVNHWPSMRGGEKESEPRRKYAATQVRKTIDSLLSAETEARIIVMGDFNQEPGKESVGGILRSVPPTEKADKHSLINPFVLINASGNGSHFYDHEWKCLDQIMYSYSLTKAGTISVEPSSPRVFKIPLLLHTNKKTGEQSPNRTYKGTKYFNGFSDHLPVTLRLISK